MFPNFVDTLQLTKSLKNLKNKNNIIKRRKIKHRTNLTMFNLEWRLLLT